MEYTAATMGLAASSSRTAPRSHRVVRPSLSSVSVAPMTLTPLKAACSPPLPTRSPLRPPARSISSQSSPNSNSSDPLTTPSNTSSLTLDSPVLPQTPSDDFAARADAVLPPTMRDKHDNTFPSIDNLVDSLIDIQRHRVAVDSMRLMTAKSPDVPLRPDSFLSLNLEEETDNDDSRYSVSTTPSSISQPSTITKRHHAMLELLSSERAYASDLALICEVHIPMAYGETSVPLKNLSQADSSDSSSHASDPSVASLGPPMTPEDVKIIFSNIAEIALFSDRLSDELEKALGSVVGPVVEGNRGDEDYIGALFLRIIPDLERPYKYYITRHSTALEHLRNLPPTPALSAYLKNTQSVASSKSHAWDISSLLIKPVQRLLKYPLLLNSIIDETPDSHPDKKKLRIALEKIEIIARDVNEGRRRVEVVKDVLTAKSPKKPLAPVTVSASVSLARMKSLKVSHLSEGNSEAAQVEAMQAELKRLEVFAQQIARNVVDWGKMMSNMLLALRMWALSFGKVIGLSQDQGSEAFDAFMDVVTKSLMPLSSKLELEINEKLMKDLAHLLTTMNQPNKLLTSMSEQEPYHYHLLTMNVSAKNRPPPSLLAASTNYLALRGQLAAELPTYLGLMHRGFAVFVRRLAVLQTEFWQDVRDRWKVLWEMLMLEGESNIGSDETCVVWLRRWADIDDVVRSLNCMKPVKDVIPHHHQQQQPQHHPSPNPSPKISQKGYQPQTSTNLDAFPGYYVPTFKEKEKEKERERKGEKYNSRSSGGSKKSIPNIYRNIDNTINILNSLNPSHSHTSSASVGSSMITGPVALGSLPASKRGRRQDSNESSNTRRPSSQDSTMQRVKRVGKSPSRRKTPRPTIDELEEFLDAHAGGFPVDGERERYFDKSAAGSGSKLPRMKSMPLGGLQSDKASTTTVTTKRTAKGNGLIMPPVNGAGYVMEGDLVYFQPPANENFEEYEPYLEFQGEQMAVSKREKEKDRERGRDTSRLSVPKSNATPIPRNEKEKEREKDKGSPKQKSNESSSKHARNRSGSIKSFASFFTGSGSALTASTSSATTVTVTPPVPSQRDSWAEKPSKYLCQVVHECVPPTGVSYYSFPFFTLLLNELFEVLHEAGHPSIHPTLPLHLDGGEDCLLLCRDRHNVVGWALASYLVPITMPD